mmetsp:Transcript_657/g.888  ORF Transcript_657/g.888 Transcript_657/m.888 type:complete len:243 (-) Transcript_657:206-934(-)
MRTDQSSPACSNAVKEAIMIAEHELQSLEGTKRMADLFGITIPIHYSDFFFFYADIFTMGVQYGTRVDMCANLTAAEGEKDALMKAVAALATNGGVSYDQYDAKALSNPTINADSSLRQWSWQYCTEFGFFQTPNDEQPLRSRAIDIDFWPDYCGRIFGTKVETRTDDTNKLYGGLDIEGDNIFFLNGSEDPWQYAAMRELRHPKTTQSTMKTAYINCDSCAHCVDFHTPSDDQPEALTKAQ